MLLSVLLGGLIGMEREVAGKPAGLRTNILICAAATLLTDVSIGLSVVDGRQVGDPARLAAQIITGVGFLGAGTIMQGKGTITGLTSAATIWMVAAIGIAIGAGHYFEAGGAGVLVMLVLSGLGPLEYKLRRARRVVSATVRGTHALTVEDLHKALAAAGIEVLSEEIYQHPDDRVFELKLAGPARQFDVIKGTLLRREDVLGLYVH
jgi:putative Mg2+ transporter-C (MgtC) family protein